VDEENCLVPDADPSAAAAAVSRLFADSDLRERLGRRGLATAARYDWAPRIEALEQFMLNVARPRSIEPSTDVVPGPRGP
jgi:glycosyltransferase involved in cell wall biosynthesis